MANDKDAENDKAYDARFGGQLAGAQPVFYRVVFLLMQGSAHRLIAAFLGMMAVRAAMTIYMKRKNAGANEGRS